MEKIPEKQTFSAKMGRSWASQDELVTCPLYQGGSLAHGIGDTENSLHASPASVWVSPQAEHQNQEPVAHGAFIHLKGPSAATAYTTESESSCVHIHVYSGISQAPGFQQSSRDLLFILQNPDY